MGFIDGHIHIDFYNDINRVIMEIIKTKSTAVFVTYMPELYEKYYPKIKKVGNIYLALGYHPSIITEYEFNSELFLKYLESAIFLGEVGLDYTLAKTGYLKDKQKEIFNYICKRSRNKILSIHSRKSEREVFEILRKNDVKGAVFHWYTGNVKLVNNIIDSGYYFSVNHRMLQTQNGVNVLKSIPLENIILETDGPFTKYKGKIVSIKDLPSVYSEFAEFYSKDLLEFKKIIGNNFEKLLEKKTEKSFQSIRRCV